MREQQQDVTSLIPITHLFVSAAVSYFDSHAKPRDTQRDQKGVSCRAREELAGPCLAGAVQRHVAGPSPRSSGETNRGVSCRVREELGSTSVSYCWAQSKKLRAMLCCWAQSKKLCCQIALDTSSWCHKPGMFHDHGHASCPMPAFAGVVLCCWAQSKKLRACWNSVVLLGPVRKAQGLLEQCCVAGPSPKSSGLAGAVLCCWAESKKLRACWCSVVLLGPVRKAQGLLEQCCVAGPSPESSGLAGVMCCWAQSQKPKIAMI